LIWWAALNLRGRAARGSLALCRIQRRAHGAGLLQLLSPTTCTLHYGLMDVKGNLDVQLTFDHRVLDGPRPHAPERLEGVLLGELLAEVRGMQQARAA